MLLERGQKDLRYVSIDYRRLRFLIELVRSAVKDRDEVH